MLGSLENVRKLVRQHSRHEHQIDGELYRPEYGIEGDETKNEKIWKLMKSYQAIDKHTIQTSIVHHVEYTLAKNRFTFTNKHCYQAVAHSLRDRLIETYNDTQAHMHNMDNKRVYYFSFEYLLGRHMQNTLINLNLQSQYSEALLDLGFNLEAIEEQEVDPGLGNGGLGRLAACFLDSLATLDYSAWGYGIRYNYGIFKQKIEMGYQIEEPDYWLQQGNPWEIQRSDVQYKVNFYGNVKKIDLNGQQKIIWENFDSVLAVAYDNPLPGYNTFNSINLRLWKSIPVNEFEFEQFNKGDYFKSVEKRQEAEYITSILYPNDTYDVGKELRLKQQYFFVCASLQDIIRRFKKKKRDWRALPHKIAIQLNDTHPALAIVELLRILIDEENLNESYAFDIAYNVFSYTNHTVLPEALEKWSIDLIQKLLPRHLDIIYQLNHHWLLKVEMSQYEKQISQSRTFFIGGKAAHGYIVAKNIIKFINSVADVLNNDQETKDNIMLIFCPDYNVSNAEVIIPAAEISQHISMAGTEASGTSNMKFIMNGCILLGTMDGANVEIAEEIGQENMFIFGAKENEIQQLTMMMKTSKQEEYICDELQKVFKSIDDGMFGYSKVLQEVINPLRQNQDKYLLCYDFLDYCKCQAQVDINYKNQFDWQKKSILSSVRSAKFSSDRTIIEYADEIWKIKPTTVPNPSKSAVSRVKSFHKLDN